MNNKHDDPLGFFRGCIFALPFCCIFWSAIVFIVLLAILK